MNADNTFIAKLRLLLAEPSPEHWQQLLSLFQNTHKTPAPWLYEYTLAHLQHWPDSLRQNQSITSIQQLFTLIEIDDGLPLLKKLTLKDINLTPPLLKILIDTPQLQKITQLCLDHNPIGDSGLQSLLDATLFKQLTCISLDHTKLTDQSLLNLLNSPHFGPHITIHLYKHTLPPPPIRDIWGTYRRHDPKGHLFSERAILQWTCSPRVSKESRLNLLFQQDIEQLKTWSIQLNKTNSSLLAPFARLTTKQKRTLKKELLDLVAKKKQKEPPPPTKIPRSTKRRARAYIKNRHFESETHELIYERQAREHQKKKNKEEQARQKKRKK